MTSGKVLGIDPGEKRIGAAISDETAILARPLMVISSSSREVDAAKILELAEEQQAGTIVVGLSLDEDGKPTYMGRRSKRLAGALKAKGSIEVILWDESFSTKDAKAARLAMGVRREQRSGHIDDAAASVMLQSYLDAQNAVSE